MRIPFLSRLMASPFDGLQEHVEKIIECAGAFQQAMECHVSGEWKKVEELTHKVNKLESEADAIKQNIRGHLPKGTLLPVDKFELFRYLREQDQVLDTMKDALNWLSFRSEPGIPKELEKNFHLLVEAVIDPIEELSRMVFEAKKHFKRFFYRFSEKQRGMIKDIIRNLQQQEHEADKVEEMIKQEVSKMETDPITVFHIFRLAETIGSIADHAENASDMMRAMIAR
jgi:predicted phosphate transport protein (TIGR00153 family)